MGLKLQRDPTDGKILRDTTGKLAARDDASTEPCECCPQECPSTVVGDCIDQGSPWETFAPVSMLAEWSGIVVCTTCVKVDGSLWVKLNGTVPTSGSLCITGVSGFGGAGGYRYSGISSTGSYGEFYSDSFCTVFVANATTVQHNHSFAPGLLGPDIWVSDGAARIAPILNEDMVVASPHDCTAPYTVNDSHTACVDFGGVTFHVGHSGSITLTPCCEEEDI